MEAKEKAKELVEKFKDYVHGYVGSSMLTNHEYPEQILAQAKKAALIIVEEILKANPSAPILSDSGYFYDDIVESGLYWLEVKEEIGRVEA